MKRQTYTVIAMIVLVGSMAVVAQAQGSDRIRLTADVPFEFNVGNKTMPAGKYTVSQINSNRVGLRLQNQDGTASVMLQMNGVIGRAPQTAKLIFHRYGNSYFFAEAWVDGDSTGMQAPKSRAEKAAQRGLAGMSETVALKRR